MEIWSIRAMMRFSIITPHGPDPGPYYPPVALKPG